MTVHSNSPPAFQWNGFRSGEQKAANVGAESSELFPTITTADALTNTMLPVSQQNQVYQQPQMNMVQSPVSHFQPQHEYNSPTSTNSSFSQAKPNHQFEDYRYSNNRANWLYGPAANIPSGHSGNEYPLDGQQAGSSLDDVGTTLSHEDSIRPRTESSYTSVSSPDSYLSDDSSERQGRSNSTPYAKIHKDSTGKTKRSRMGCLTCRHRKKRCCETRPRCTECDRLGLKCTWPVPGLEHRNRPKNAKINDDMHYDAFYGHIKILRGIVEYRINAA